ncbi:MAG: ABC transporter ATP-binding protein, partial [Candidatus Methanomethylophilaceae archaeon]|nr:ABC transporter ATP-binding protein [Candidatus Methanomethylophilaceae archaeon]
MSDEWPIEIENLRKEYGEFVALNNLNLKIKKNSFTGLLGPNGAGKSTTLKILTHLINATSGSAYLDGVDVTVDPKKALSRVGTVIETPEFYGYLTPRETMRYVGELIGMRKERIKDQTEQILEKVKMTEWGDKKLGTFSKGMRQRIAIGQSLMNDPRIIILDEPTSGLDPRGMAEMREILKNLRNESKDLTIVMSSHILPEVQDLCDRIAMINHGNLLMDGDISKFTSISGARTMIVQTKDIPTDDLISRIGSLEYVHDAERFGNDIQVVINEDMDTRQRLFDDLSRMNAGVY